MSQLAIEACHAAVSVSRPNSPNIRAGLPPSCLGGVGEIGVQMELERQRRGRLREVRHVHVLVKTIADEPRQAELDRLLRDFSGNSLGLRTAPKRWRRRDVVSEPGVLLDVR
jgi:hypothetical protein